MEPKPAPPFIVGEAYLDRDGEYTVIAVEGNRLVFERENGTRSTGDVAMKARIHRNILSERSNTHSFRNRRISFAGNQPLGFSQSEVFPIIAAAIGHHSKPSHPYVTHNDIVALLIEDPELRPLLDQLTYCDPQQKTISWWASTMVAWFSQAITVGRSDWDGRFERKKVDGSWAYRVRTS